MVEPYSMEEIEGITDYKKIDFVRIGKTVEQCTDAKMLDLLTQLLKKAIQEDPTSLK